MHDFYIYLSKAWASEDEENQPYTKEKILIDMLINNLIQCDDNNGPGPGPGLIKPLKYLRLVQTIENRNSYCECR